MPSKKTSKASLKGRKEQAEAAKQEAGAPVPGPPAIAPKPHLPVTTLLPEQLFVVHGFLSPSEAHRIKESLESHGLKPTPPPPPCEAAEYAVRRMQRTSFESREYADALWTRSGLPFILSSVEMGVDGELTGLNPNIRGYRYDAGDRFGRHYDGSYELPGGNGMLHTEYTVLIYLGDDGLEGGETVFWLPDPGFQTGKRKAGTVAGKTGSKARGYSRAAHGTGGDEENDVCTDGMCELAVPATKGTLLIHRHGDACLLHEGRKVIRGSKYVLRTDLVFELRGR